MFMSLEISTSSASSSGTRRKWTIAEDATLVACMVELHGVGRYNANSGFKNGYMGELERMLQQKIRNCGLKAKPYIDSRIRNLKKEWQVVYDMKNASGFGWDETRKIAIAKNNMWEAYLASHKDAAGYRTKAFPPYDELTLVFAKDRSTGKDFKPIHEVLREAETENLRAPVEANFEEQPPYNQEQEHDSGGSSSGRKRKRES